MELRLLTIIYLFTFISLFIYVFVCSSDDERRRTLERNDPVGVLICGARKIGNYSNGYSINPAHRARSGSSWG